MGEVWPENPALQTSVCSQPSWTLGLTPITNKGSRKPARTASIRRSALWIGMEATAPWALADSASRHELILDYDDPLSQRRQARRDRLSGCKPPTWDEHFARV